MLTCLHFSSFILPAYMANQTQGMILTGELGHGQNRTIMDGKQGVFFFLIIVTFLVFHGLNEFK
jgi:hypothetical protein